MSSPLVAVLCTALLVLCVGRGMRCDTADHPQVVDSVKLVIVSKQDDAGKWVNEVKLEHGNELAPWKVEVEQKTLEKSGRQSVELSATLTGPKPAPKPIAAPREITGSLTYPGPSVLGRAPHIQPGGVRFQASHHDGMEKTVFKELRSSWQGSQYTVLTTEMDWVTANKACTDAGSYLAIINSKEEAMFFAKMLSQLSAERRGAFVGITDEGQEGNWTTVQGVPISEAGFDQWFSSEQPDNAGGNENCGLFLPLSRGLNDIPCIGYRSLTICEKVEEATTIEQTEDILNDYLDTYEDETDWAYPEKDDDTFMSKGEKRQEVDEPENGFKNFPGFSSFYKVHTKQMDWKAANKTCEEEGAHLAVINSEGEAMMLASLLKRLYVGSYRGAFVGITDEAEEGTWLTIFGETTAEAGFARWFRDDQPDNANGNENCGAIFPMNGGFNDVPCTEYLMHSICEKEENTDTAILVPSGSDSLEQVTTQEPEETESRTETIEESKDILSAYEMTTELNDFTREKTPEETKTNAEMIEESKDILSTTEKDPTTLSFVRHSDLHLYKLHLDTDKNWQQAQATCEMDGAVVTRMESIDEFMFIVDLLRQSPLAGSSKVFARFGNRKRVESYRFGNADDDNDAIAETELCEAIDISSMSMVVVHCHDRLPFICEINPLPDFAEENSGEASEEFENAVELVSLLSNSEDETKGGLFIIDYISQNREPVMTTLLPSAEVDYDEMSPWAYSETGSVFYNEYQLEI